MGVYGGPANSWSNITNSNRIDASTKVLEQSGLVLNLDASASTSYPGSGTNWTDLSLNGNNGTLLLVGGPTYSSISRGSIVFDGENDNVSIGTNGFSFGSSPGTLSAWAKSAGLSFSRTISMLN